ncbi:hypothetical protein [Saccharopolyspora rectivirgula]|jgi:uncharacterized membrane protein YhdT|uniref:Uncharacterized protein n=1 Tax=Saccharopolyspora rectivirgula TaxID=28042 RepID=A0A073B2E0_9PSEU|nr:hypothetical protein [Saccharopolyspora rectivirgula]KEI45457.1 hypothetical protein GU90_03165 [Saccharopolyspora rectivirgula]
MGSTDSQAAVLRVAVVLFGLGLAAVVAIFVLFALGLQDLPLWLNLAALLCPLGLICGVVGVIMRARRR